MEPVIGYWGGKLQLVTSLFGEMELMMSLLLTIVATLVLEHPHRALGFRQKALRFREENTHMIDTWADFKIQIEKGGFIMAHWDGTAETEEKIKDETKATIRCIPLDAPEQAGKCVYSGEPSNMRVVFARAY